MKISALASGGIPGVNLSNSGPNTDRIAAAKAIAAGENPITVTKLNTPIDEELEAQRVNARRIKMRTNLSPDRPVSEAEPVAAEPGATEGVTPDESVQATVVEETKPLSPQVAALARERRAIQRERVEVEALRKELEAKSNAGREQLISELKAQPLRVLLEQGVTYDQLTEAILSGSEGPNSEIQALKSELKAIKDGVDKTLVDRDTAQEQAVLAEMQREAQSLARADDTFELVREERCIPDVIRLIHETYKKTGEVLEVTDAMQLVEDELLKENLRRAKFKKIQSQFAPAATQPIAPKQNQMRTLTSRDSAPVSMSRRDRAIMAASGTLRKG